VCTITLPYSRYIFVAFSPVASNFVKIRDELLEGKGLQLTEMEMKKGSQTIFAQLQPANLTKC
jgi:hypothetical protein